MRTNYGQVCYDAYRNGSDVEWHELPEAVRKAWEAAGRAMTKQFIGESLNELINHVACAAEIAQGLSGCVLGSLTPQQIAKHSCDIAEAIEAEACARATVRMHAVVPEILPKVV